MPEWRLRAIEPPLGRLASTPAFDLLLPVVLEKRTRTSLTGQTPPLAEFCRFSVKPDS
jgi:hypothetical protein